MKIAVLFPLLLLGCTPGGSPTIPPTVANVGQCVFDTVSKDMLSGMSFPAAVEDAAIKCLGSASPDNLTQVQNLWGSAKAAFERTRGLDGGGNPHD